MTLTFGLDLILYNFMTVYYSATPRRMTLDLGALDLGGIVIPVDRLLGMVLALAADRHALSGDARARASAAPSSPCAWTARRPRSWASRSTASTPSPSASAR